MRGTTQDRRARRSPGPAGGSTRWRAGAATLLAGVLAAVTAAAGLPAAAASRPHSWRIIKTVHGPGQIGITALTATGRGRAWAFETTLGRPSAWRLTGSAWAAAPFPGRPGDMVTAAGSTSASNVWAFTAQASGASRALRWNGARWAVVRAFRQAVGSALVLGPADVWVFGQPGAAGGGLGAWHYTGSAWRRSAGLSQLTGASALGPRDIWAVGGKTAAHWNGTRWRVTSLARVLPGNTLFCRPSADYVLARSPRDVWAAGAGNCQDERGPFYLLHFNGASWRLVARSARYGEPLQLTPDGSGGMWIPAVAGFPGTFAMLHYAGGTLRPAVLPLAGSRLTVAALGQVPGTRVTYGGGASYPASSPGQDRSAVILRYAP